ncbi:Protein of unknown function [Pyronema omphalodes CBS 100304]|uniref:Uncharacterized protein n=1 Tax=Pyronema omphalodes (strain CBS 100304) TaxID=1076935 RepID=U4LDK9_PYROM|nr:Protein of unknown function [Pyronema omphalodes CBS 100304]
MALTSSRFK